MNYGHRAFLCHLALALFSLLLLEVHNTYPILQQNLQICACQLKALNVFRANELL